MWDSVSKKTEDHNKLGTSAVAFTWNSASNLWCIYAQTQIYIYIFSFSLAAISKFLGRYMTNHIEYFARTWVTFHNITSRRSLHILFFWWLQWEFLFFNGNEVPGRIWVRRNILYWCHVDMCRHEEIYITSRNCHCARVALFCCAKIATSFYL